jgi:hypothetical protein
MTVRAWKGEACGDVANRFSGEANPESVMPCRAEVRVESQVVGWFVMTRSASGGDWGES